MLLHIDKLKRRPRQISVDEEISEFSCLQDLVDQGDVSFDGAIHGDLEAVWAGEIIKVTGHLSALITLPCSRCLVPVSSRLDVPVTLCYAGKADDGESTTSAELQIQSEELGLVPFSGEEIDLRADVEQEIIMALPQQPLCQNDCRGLCPSCGCVLNQQACSCEAPVLHPGLAALKDFKIR